MDKIDDERAERQQQRPGAVVHQQQIVHDEIGVIAEDRGELRQRRSRCRDGEGEGQRQRQQVGRKEITVVHVRQQKGNPDCKDRRRKENELLVQTSAEVQGQTQEQQNKEKRGKKTRRGRGLSVPRLADQGINGGGVVVEAAADAARLRKVERERFPEGTARKNRVGGRGL